YGLGYDQLKAELPRLIYCSLTGFGQTGPYAPRAGFDLVVQGQGGVMSITGDAGGRPAKVGVGIADIMTGMYCNIAILAALRHRDRTGEGQHIDLALLDTTVSWLVNEGMNYLHTGGIPKAMGTAHATIVPYQAFQTSDGYFILAVGNDGQFKKFADFVGHPEWAADARFKTNAARCKHRDEIVPAVEAQTRRKPTDFWLDALPPLGIPCGPVNTIDKVFADPQVQHRGMRIEIEHPAAGTKVPYIGSPIKMSKTPVSYRRAAPRMGEHNDEVLAELLGLSAGEIGALRGKGAI
ncbi:MAG: CaiB/BaiF CoA transferase family protein, partial [Alphaproteobacteria bacterium]